MEKNLFFTSDPMQEMKEFLDVEVLQHLKSAIKNKWDINTSYGDTYSHYNALHACCVNYHLKSAHYLLKMGLDPNSISGNRNTPFTFLLQSVHNKNIDTNYLLNFCEVLKIYGANLSAPGYDGKSPIELIRNQIPDQKIIDYLIKHTDFENTFLLNEFIISDTLCTVSNFKKIMSEHTIDLKKVVIEYGDTQTYWNSIAFSLGRIYRRNYEKLTWLHDNVGFDLDAWHKFSEYETDNTDTDYHTNLLGMAIHNKNIQMFNWVLKRKPEHLYDKFYVNNKPYSLLEFSLLSNFRKTIGFSLKNMSNEEFNSLDIHKLRQMCDDPLTLENLEKNYTAVRYKFMSNILENNKNKKLIKI